MKRVLLVISNLRQAAYRLRWETLLPGLQDAGIEVDVRVRPSDVIGRYRLARQARAYEAVIIQRKLLDGWEAKVYRRCAKKLYFDVDDAVMHHAREVGAIARWRQLRRFTATARVLDMAVVGNEYLRQQFANQGCPAQILPTLVDPDHYRSKVHRPVSGIRLVWIGSRSTLSYLSQALPSIEAVQTQALPIELIIIADAAIESKVIKVTALRWSEQTEAEALATGDVGIAPTPDTPWAMGKCGFKILQYMASSLPVIASPVGANATIVSQGQTGFLPRTSGEWAEAIGKLAASAELRQAMGNAGREEVLSQYTLQRGIEFWSELLNRR